MKSSRNKVVGVLLGGACAGCLALAIWGTKSARERNDLKAQNNALQPRLDAASRRAESSTVETKRWQAEAADLQAQIGRNANDTPTASVSAPPPVEKPRSRSSDVAAQYSNPALRNMIASQMKPQVELIYGDLFKGLQLAPEAHDQLGQFLVEKQVNQADFTTRMMDQNLTEQERANLAKQLADANAATDAKVRDLLNNDAAFADYQTYAQQQWEHMEVSQLRNTLASANQPLDDDQAAALVKLIYDTRQGFSFTQNFYDPAILGRQAQDGRAVTAYMQEYEQMQDRAVQNASAVLTPAQLEIFRQNQAAFRQSFQTKINYLGYRSRQMNGESQ